LLFVKGIKNCTFHSGQTGFGHHGGKVLLPEIYRHSRTCNRVPAEYDSKVIVNLQSWKVFPGEKWADWSLIHDIKREGFASYLLFVAKGVNFCRRMSKIEKNSLLRYWWKCIAHAWLYSVWCPVQCVGWCCTWMERPTLHIIYYVWSLKWKSLCSQLMAITIPSHFTVFKPSQWNIEAHWQFATVTMTPMT
jgi:hypothetical protein